MSSSPQRDRQYWRRNLLIVSCLLTVWFIVGIVLSILCADALNGDGTGTPWGFWMAQQGAIMIFVVLILIYCLLMDRTDKEFSDPLDDDATKPSLNREGDA